MKGAESQRRIKPYLITTDNGCWVLLVQALCGTRLANNERKLWCVCVCVTCAATQLLYTTTPVPPPTADC